MIPAAITHLQESFFRTAKTDADVLESTSTHPCHRLSIPAAKLFWCRHCMQIFEDPITRWRHSKTCLQSSSGKLRKDKDGSTMQVFLSSNNLSELRREQNISRAISRSAGALHSRGPDLQCFICKTAFVSIDEMRVHVRNPCRKRPKIATPKNKVLALPTDVKTEIQIPKTASEIIYIKDGHQTVISLESPYTTQTIEPVSETPVVETALPVAPKTEELAKQPDDRTENKENNIRKRKRILPKEVDDRPNHKTNNSPKSEQQIALSLPTRPDDIKDTLEDIEVPPMKFCKMTNKEAEDEMSQTKVRTKPLQTKEELGQLLIGEKKDNQVFLVGEHLSNGVITEQVADGDIFLKAPASPEEKIVTGDAAEAKLKDLFTSMEMMNKTKLSRSPKQTKTVSSPRKSPKKTGSPMKTKSSDACQNDDLQKDKTQTIVSQESLNTSGWLLHMAPINAGSVTLHDPLLDLQNGLPAEMLLDETTNTKPPIPAAPEAINATISSNIMEITKIPSHIFDGDLLPSQIHSEVLFDEITEEKEHPPLVDDRPAEELVSTEMNIIKMVSPVGINKAEEELGKFIPVGQVFSVGEIVNKENAQIFESIEEILLPVTIDHVEEIAHTHMVTLEDIPFNATVVPMKAIVSHVEGATHVETIAPGLEPIFAETVPSVEEATIPVKTVTPVPETPPVESVSSIKESIPIETLASVLEATKIENVPLVEETNHIEAFSAVQGSISIEAVPSVEEPSLIEAVPSFQEPTLTETIPPVQESITIEGASPVQEPTSIETVPSVKESTDVVLPVMEDIPVETIPSVKNTTPIKISNADKDFVDEAPSLKSLSENQEIPLEETESEQINKEKMSNETAEPVPAKTKTKDETDEEDEASVAEQAKTEVKTKPAKLFKCKACSNTFKTSQALQKHSRVPCILKHTRSLSQKILRPKQPCMKIEKKPLKKKLSRSSRRPKFMIPIMPITRSELIRPAVPKRPKRFSRRKKRRSFFIDEHNRILPYVNVIMSELSDKDRFFYKLGMINQCRKIPSSETTTTTAPNAETSAVETLDEDSAVDSSSSTLQFTGIKTESINPLEIGPLSAAAAEVAAAEPLGIAYPATPAAACVSDKENLSALAKGLCLSLPTLEKMDDTQFHDPNCISPSHVKSVPDDPPRDPSGATGQSVQSTCWEVAPRLAQLPGVTQIVRVTSTNPSSADLLNGIDATSKPPVIPESDRNNVLANSKGLSFSNSSLHCKMQSKKISKETVNKPVSNISAHLAAKNPALKLEKTEILNSKETFGNVFENGAIQPKTVSVSLQELNICVQSGSVATGKDYTTLDVNKKILPNSISKVKIQKSKEKKKASAENKKRLRKVRIISPDQRNRSRSSVDKNSTKSKQNSSQTAKPDVTDSASPSKSHNFIKDRNQKQTDSRTGAKIETGKKKHRSMNSCILNSRKRISSSSKKVTTLSTKKVTSKQNSTSFSSPCKKGGSNLKSPLTTPTSGKKGGSNPKSPMTSPTLSKKGGSNPKSLMSTPTSSKKGGSNQKSPMTTPTSKKGASSQKSPMTTPNSSKKMPSSQKSPISIPLSKKVPLDQKSPITLLSSKKVPSKQKTLMSTPNSSKKIPSNQKSPMTTLTSSKKVPSNQKSPITPTSSKKIPSNPKSPITPTSSKKVPSNQKSPSTTPTCKKIGSRNESPIRTPQSKKGGSNKGSLLDTPTSSKKGGTSKESPVTTQTSCKKIASNQKSAIATSSSNPQSVSLRRRIQPQQKTRRKESNDSRAIHMKAPSKLTISTRSSPLKKAIHNQAIELLRTQKNIGSFIKKKASKSRKRENRVCKPTRCSLKSKVASKSLQIEKRISSRISDVSPQNSKNVIPNGESHTRDCEVALIKYHSTEILYSLSEKSSASSEESSPKKEIKHGSKNQKHAKPFSETRDAASPSRVTRRTQKLDNSLAEPKDTQKLASDATKHNKSSPESKSSVSPPRNNLKDPQNVSKPIKDSLDHGKRNSSQERRVSKKPEISENQSRISRTNTASPTSENKPRKNNSPVRKSPARTKQRLDSPSRLSSSNDHSNSDSIPYLRNRFISKSDLAFVKNNSAENDIATLSNKLISKSLVNATATAAAAYSMSSRSKSKLCSEPITNSVSVDKESVSNRNISSFSTYHDIKLDLSPRDKSINEQCNETNREKINARNGLGLNKDSGDSWRSSEIGSCSIAQVTAGISAVSCVEQDNQGLGNERSVRMTESPIKSIDVNEKLKDLKLSSPPTELPSGESSDPHDTGTTAVVTVRNMAVSTETSINSDNMANTNLVEYESSSLNSAPLNVSTITTLNPRTTIATQTDTSFIKETKTGQNVPSGSCDNVDNEEPLSSNPDPLPAIPSSPSLENTIPAFTSVDDNPPSTVLSEAERCAELVQENLHLDPNSLPSPQEIVVHNAPASPASLYPPGTICELVQEDSGLQVDNTGDSVLLQQSVLDPSNTVALESPLQQFVLDNGTDPNVIMQYLNSLDPSMVPQEVTFVIIQGTPGEPLQLTDDFIIEQTALSEHAEHESASQQVIYAIQPPQSDITTEAECIMTDST